jgi:hypothetical protein
MVHVQKEADEFMNSRIPILPIEVRGKDPAGFRQRCKDLIKVHITRVMTETKPLFNLY